MAPNADRLDGLDSAAFASAGNAYSKTESDVRFLGITAKASDSEKLDGLDSSASARAGSFPDTHTKHAEGFIDFASQGSVNVFCDAGDRAPGGGYETHDEFRHVVGSYPDASPGGFTDWRTDSVNVGRSNKLLKTWVCALT